MLVNPAMVAEVAPSATDVVPYCTVLLANLLFAMEPASMVFVTVPLSLLPIRVPLVGSVTLVDAVTVSVVANAPLVTRLPPRVMVFAPLLTPVPPYVEPTTVAVHVPDVTVPTEVRLLPVTPLPNAELVNTSVPLILYVLPVKILKFSLDVHAVFALTQLSVLSDAPFTVIPAPSAVVSVGDAMLANSIFLSSTDKVVEFMVVVVPFTVKSPVTVSELFTVTNPPFVLPILTFVVDEAAPPVPMLTVFIVEAATAPVDMFVVLAAVPVYPTVNVVALANAPKVAPESIVVANVGEVENTNVPLPVSSVTAESKFALLGVPRNVAIPVPREVIPVPPFATGNVPVTPLDRGKFVAFVRFTLVGVPSTGVTSVGLVANTNAPLPVSSLMTPASSADVVAAKTLSLFAT